MTDHPRSQRFDDIYFSQQDGLAETDHVFLKGNDLPERWTGRAAFTIAETGFGTGLNFLSVWTLFDETAADDAVLDYVSFELYPLSADEIGKALSHWSGAFGGRLEKLVSSYPLRIPGWHRIDFAANGRIRVRLTLIFDDVNAALPRLAVPRGVDAWFLDGFAPAKNPQMWSDVVFENMARLSGPGATFSSFTAAGLAKDGLRKAGFAVRKTRGYGRKRDMIIGHFAREISVFSPVVPKRVAIIGGGLAGTACAAALRMRGIDHVLYESGDHLAAGASGNPRGIFNPRLTAQRNAQSDFYSAAFALGARMLDHNRCGSLHLITDEDKDKRFRACLENWGWHPDHMRLLPAAEASEEAGIPLVHDALFLPDSGQVSPRELCRLWAEGSTIRLSTPCYEALLDEYDAVIYACGAAVKKFPALSWLPVETVRGQIIETKDSPVSRKLKTNLCFGGYIGPSLDGAHIVGSSFQKWLETTELRDDDTRDILDKLDAAVPGLEVGPVDGGRAGLRCAAQDRFPVIGLVPDCGHCYVSTAHGSHGIISALMGAQLLADLMIGNVLCLPEDSVNTLSPQRFLERIRRRAQKTGGDSSIHDKIKGTGNGESDAL